MDHLTALLLLLWMMCAFDSARPSQLLSNDAETITNATITTQAFLLLEKHDREGNGSTTAKPSRAKLSNEIMNRSYTKAMAHSSTDSPIKGKHEVLERKHDMTKTSGQKLRSKMKSPKVVQLPRTDVNKDSLKMENHSEPFAPKTTKISIVETSTKKNIGTFGQTTKTTKPSKMTNKSLTTNVKQLKVTVGPRVEGISKNTVKQNIKNSRKSKTEHSKEELLTRRLRMLRMFLFK
ncbi:hypothetical protein Tcan_06555 [Toxocara canis]|uniref:Uncharacterized protein n=1 Tax=Toxocara canis TaxID=6265 RepID=A0A0B2V3W6_TOXCA|nr:hypothetical protein Tcan_06555 [Toxocara canis]